MAERKAQTTRRTGRQPPVAAGPGSAYERLTASVEAAQAAVKELRGELGRGSRELLQDIEVTLRDARENLRRISRQLVKELEQVQQAAAGRPAAKRSATAAGRGASGRPQARKRSGTT